MHGVLTGSLDGHTVWGWAWFGKDYPIQLYNVVITEMGVSPNMTTCWDQWSDGLHL